MRAHRLALALLPLALAACATTGGTATPSKATDHHRKPVDATPAEGIGPSPRRVSPYAPAQEDPTKRGDYVAGGLFRPAESDAVPDYIPDVDAIPEPEVRAEPRARSGNRDYAVLGKRYKVLDSAHGYMEQGGASYYGNKFHGRRTSSGEVYDMYAFTAAHKSLPLPSYARVTNLDNGKSVVVRVNDRGPFHSNRIIDLSYAAAVKLGYREKGVARVEVRALTPGASSELAVGYRFDMQQDGRVMSADEFDAWMTSRRVRVATGKPGTPDPAVAAATAAGDGSPQPAASPPPSPVNAAALVAPSAPPAGGSAEQVTLQVASFANQQNAQHALAMLQGAAIGRAQLFDTDVNGKKVWRLRIGPVDVATAPELAARVVGLGFGQPQRVRD